MAIRADLLPTSLINIDLAKIFIAEFVADIEFGRHGFDYQRKKYKRASGKRQLIGVVTERCSGDPWWWPTENGESEEQWALASDNRDADRATLTELLSSLRGGITTFVTGTRKASAWKGFPGSLAAQAGCCIVLSTRPSIGGFPSPNTIKLYDVLAAVWPGGEFLRHVHVTDLSKFRGPTQDSDFEGMTTQMWQKSIRCLRQEFELLKPKATLIMPGAERFLTTGLSDLISTVASANTANADEKVEITKDVAFLGMLRARRKHCMDQAPYWAPGNPKGGDEQKDIGHSWCDTLLNLGFPCLEKMNAIALRLECSVEADVSPAFAWRFRTDVANWNDPPAQFALDGPFEEGSCGTTLLPGQEPLRWRVAELRPGKSFVLEMQLDRATLTFEWRFDDLSEHRTKLTQLIVLSGDNAGAYAGQVEAGFGPNLQAGMRRIAAEMVAAERS